jgi:glutamate synthase domain-containing protein 3
MAIRPPDGDSSLTLVGNAFGYGARGGTAYIAGQAGNRFGICFRKNVEQGGPRVVVEGVQANAFQYMTGGVALVLGPTGANLGSGMTGGTVYLLDGIAANLNVSYVAPQPVTEADLSTIRDLLREHVLETESAKAQQLLSNFEATRYMKVQTKLLPERWDA